MGLLATGNPEKAWNVELDVAGWWSQVLFQFWFSVLGYCKKLCQYQPLSTKIETVLADDRAFTRGSRSLQVN